MKEVHSSDDEPAIKKRSTDYTDDYKRLISLMVGCQFVSFQPQTSGISFQSKSEKTKETMKRLAGSSKTLTAPLGLPNEPVTLSDLQNNPAGDIKRKKSKFRIIFYQYTTANLF